MKHNYMVLKYIVYYLVYNSIYINIQNKLLSFFYDKIYL